MKAKFEKVTEIYLLQVMKATHYGTQLFAKYSIMLFKKAVMPVINDLK